MKRVFAIEEHCIGCRICEVHCITEHSKSKNIVKAHRKELPPASRLRVHENGPLSFALQCRHCDEPSCVHSCLSGAMSKDPLSGRVIHDNDKCIGCWTCIMVCPVGAIIPDERSKKVVAKCDLCEALEIPACVDSCPNRALIFEETSP